MHLMHPTTPHSVSSHCVTRSENCHCGVLSATSLASGGAFSSQLLRRAPNTSALLQGPAVPRPRPLFFAVDRSHQSVLVITPQSQPASPPLLVDTAPRTNEIAIREQIREVQQIRDSASGRPDDRRPERPEYSDDRLAQRPDDFDVASSIVNGVTNLFSGLFGGASASTDSREGAQREAGPLGPNGRAASSPTGPSAMAEGVAPIMMPGGAPMFALPEGAEPALQHPVLPFPNIDVNPSLAGARKLDVPNIFKNIGGAGGMGAAALGGNGGADDTVLHGAGGGPPRGLSQLCCNKVIVFVMVVAP